MTGVVACGDDGGEAFGDDSFFIGWDDG